MRKTDRRHAPTRFVRRLVRAVNWEMTRDTFRVLIDLECGHREMFVPAERPSRSVPRRVYRAEVKAASVGRRGSWPCHRCGPEPKIGRL